MSTFRLELLDSLGADRFERVKLFIGADISGAFGILPRHASMVVALRYGLVRFLDDSGTWRYVALPGGILRFHDNALTVVAVRYFLGDEPRILADRLEGEMAQDDSELSAARLTLAKIDRSLVRRLANLNGNDGMLTERFDQ